MCLRCLAHVAARWVPALLGTGKDKVRHHPLMVGRPEAVCEPPDHERVGRGEAAREDEVDARAQRVAGVVERLGVAAA